MTKTKETLIFVTAGKWQLSGIIQARKMGYNIVGIDSDNYAEGFKISKYIINQDLKNHKVIIKILSKLKLNYVGVISYCSEAGMKLAAIIRKEFNLLGPNISLTNKLIDKSLQRNIFFKKKITQPKFKILKMKKMAINFIKKNTLPVIIKPADSSGSRGVFKINNMQNIAKYVDLSFSFSNSNKVIIEEFIDGDEYTVETFFLNGIMHLLAVTKKKKVPKTNGTVACELRTSSLSNKNYKKLFKIINSAYFSLGYSNGAGHAEVIFRKNKYYIIELAGRGPGFHVFDKFLPLITGIDLPKILIENCTGIKSNIGELKKLSGIISYFPSKKGKIKKISGFKSLKDLKGVYGGHFSKVGQITKEANSDGDRNGYIMTIDLHMKEAVKKLNISRKLIRITY